MRVHDKTGKPLPHARQWSELSIFFYAGVSLCLALLMLLLQTCCHPSKHSIHPGRNVIEI